MDPGTSPAGTALRRHRCQRRAGSGDGADPGLARRGGGARVPQRQQGRGRRADRAGARQGPGHGSPPRRQRPRLGPRLRGRPDGRGPAGRRAGQQRGGARHPLRTVGGGRGACTSRPTTSATSRSPSPWCRCSPTGSSPSGSREHRSGHLDLDDLGWLRRPYRAFAAYGDSKARRPALHARSLDRRLRAAGSPLRSVAAHPGASATGITGSTGNAVLTAIGHHGQRLVSMPAWRGALCTVYAATTDVPGGTYVGPHGRTEPVGLARTGPDVAEGGRRAAWPPHCGSARWSLTGVDLPGQNVE
ncbi:hypothetical protein [Nocardioides convexus]|uniref:hypothetical protein n=1 Tax=Nocardioides convexus TaxID=2712224 RepID=UPI0024184542|nr:hypothetical protein [Nocardioides convexus]